MTSSADLDDLAVLAPVGRVVPFGDRQVEILPITMKQLPGVVRALKDVDLSAGVDAAALPALFLRHSDAVLEALSVATHISREEIEARPMDEVAVLLMSAWLVNDDFFARRVIPAVTSLITTPGSTPGAGPTPSSS